jgi:hypothetical protein
VPTAWHAAVPALRAAQQAAGCVRRKVLAGVGSARRQMLRQSAVRASPDRRARHHGRPVPAPVCSLVRAREGADERRADETQEETRGADERRAGERRADEQSPRTRAGHMRRSVATPPRRSRRCGVVGAHGRAPPIARARSHLQAGPLRRARGGAHTHKSGPWGLPAAAISSESMGTPRKRARSATRRSASAAGSGAHACQRRDQGW